MVSNLQCCHVMQRMKIPRMSFFKLLAVTDTVLPGEKAKRLFLRLVLLTPAHDPCYAPSHQGSEDNQDWPSPPHSPFQYIQRLHNLHVLPKCFPTSTIQPGALRGPSR